MQFLYVVYLIKETTPSLQSIWFSNSIYNCLQQLAKLDLTNLQIAYNHKTRFGTDKFC